MKKKSQYLTAEQILRIVLDTIPIRVLWKDVDSTFLGGNQKLLDDLGLKSIDQLAGKKDSDFFEDSLAVKKYVQDDMDVIQSGKSKIAIEEVLNVPGQPPKWLKTNKIPMFDKDNKVIGLLATYEEITEQVEYRQKIELQALVDPLTGIANRRQLQATMDEYTGQYAALLFIDLDYFKAVNDSLGHSVGDMLLQEISLRLTTLCQGSNMTLARLGGDEFSIFVPYKTPEQIHTDIELLAKNIVELMLGPFFIEHHILSIGASVGITIVDKSLGKYANGFREADMAMYCAKELGRNNYQFYDDSMREDADRKHKLAFYMRSAIEKKEFSVVYQPQVNEKDELIGAEALLRWNNKELGSVSPDEFIALAEETGLIQEIGQWVLMEALDALASWSPILLANPNFKLAVNASSKQFQNKKLPGMIEKALKVRGLNPNNLQLEITESVLMDYADSALKSMLKVQKLGVSIAIDDFGTGYSSLSYLAILPIDKLKIDRSFVTDLHKKETNRKLVETLVNMSKNLQMEVIAEGVESLKEKQALVELGCFQFQGYYFCRPISNDAMHSKYINQK